MGKRLRIENELLETIVTDELSFVQNKSSKNAKKIMDKSESIELEIWCDKHYYNRVELGDKGGRRLGIEEKNVKSLIVKSIAHLFYYSFKIQSFTFVNFEQNTRNIRIVIQEQKDNGLLNVVAEFHHLKENKYQLTVITAMQKDHFMVSLGQYALEIHHGSSVLKKFNGKRLVDVCNFN